VLTIPEVTTEEHANAMNRLIPSVFVVGALGMLAACGRSESDPGAMGGVPATGGAPATGSADGTGCDPLKRLEGDATVAGPHDLEPLRGIGVVTGNLRINGVSDLSSLRCLTRVGADLWLGPDDSIPTSQGLHGPPGPNESALTHVDDLAGLASVGRDLVVTGHDGLVNLDGLRGLTSVGGTLRVTHNPVLRTLDSLAELSNVGALNVSDNAALTSLDGLENLGGRISGEVQISINEALTNLDALMNVTGVDGELGVTSNPALTSLDGLSGLSGPVRGLFVQDCNSLTNLDGLSGLSGPVGGDQVGQLVVYQNDALTNVDGLSGLSGAVGGGLMLVRNRSLTDLDGLRNVTGVGGLYVDSNPALENLRGLAALAAVGGAFEVVDNTVLPTCEAEWLRDNVGAANIGFDVTISGNDDTRACAP
jgi:hypothetical protein